MTGWIFYGLAGLFFLLSQYAAIESWREREGRAARRFFVAGMHLPLPFVVLGLLDVSGAWALGILGVLVLVAGDMFFPRRGGTIGEGIVPRGRIDERDTMFSRVDLLAGTRPYQAYYHRHPGRKKGDDRLRANPGLLSSAASFYDPHIFPAARANFELIEYNRAYVDGEVAEQQLSVDPCFLARYLKQLARKYGAVSVGITRLQDYHLYSYRGRRHHYGEPVDNDHGYALALTVEMDHDYVRNAPYALSVLESSRQYIRSGLLALWLARIIRDMGYAARAHIDGEYEVVCPLVARDAGLGEIGRMGLLMTPELGPRVRIAVVTTSAPLQVDDRQERYSMIDFCLKCRKCADVCPSRAIPFGGRENIDGVWRWQIDQQACFTYWTRTGTDCARCMSVCPFSHPNTPLHNLVRQGINHSGLFRTFAARMDDFAYGRKPKPLTRTEVMRAEGLD